MLRIGAVFALLGGLMLLTEETKTDLQVWFQYYLCPNNKIVVAGFYSEGPIIVCFLFQDYFKFQPNIISSHCGQSYKASTIIIYNARVVPDLKIPHIMTLDS